MILKITNPKLCEFGFAESFDYDKSNSGFFGHQLGLFAGIYNNETDTIESNRLPMGLENRDEILKDLIENADSYKMIQHDFNAYDMKTDTLVSKTMYLAPYVPTSASFLRPTCTDTNIDPAMNCHYELEIELLLVKEDLRRYITMHAKTVNIGMLNLVHDFFDYDYENVETFFPEDKNFLKYMSHEGEEGYGIKFYDEIGEEYIVLYNNPKDVLMDINSIRLVKCNCVIED